MHWLDSGAMRLGVDARHGSRIVSLSFAGEEWLLPSSPANDAAGRFIRPGLGGWDEAIPSVASCQLDDGTQITDHGEAWRRPWELIAASGTSLTTRIHLHTVPVLLERELALDGPVLRVSYRARAPEGAALGRLLWSAHPLFAAPAGTEVQVGDYSALVEEWPRSGRGVASLPRTMAGIAPGDALKVFAVGANSASMTRPSGATLTFAWESTEVAAVGVLWDNMCFANEPCLAIEPTFSPTDSLAEVRGSSYDDEANEIAWEFYVTGTASRG